MLGIVGSAFVPSTATPSAATPPAGVGNVTLGRLVYPYWPFVTVAVATPPTGTTKK